MRFIDKTKSDLMEILNVEPPVPDELWDLGTRLNNLIVKENEILPERIFNVKKSKEFKLSNYCNQFTAGLNLIETNFKNGVSNLPHQSLSATVTGRLDLLLNQWGIYHLHLSDNIQANGFCLRTGPVLFCFFNHDTVYFLDILEHGTNHATVWVNTDILRVIKNNWPEVLKQYEMNGVTGLRRTYTDEEMMTLRKGHVNTSLEIDGAYYMSPGLGILGSGDSTRYTLRSNQIIRQIKHAVKHCFDHGDFQVSEWETLKDIFPKKDKYTDRPAILRLKKSEQIIILYEERTLRELQGYDLFCPIGK